MKESVYASSIPKRYDLINAVLDNFDNISTLEWLEQSGFNIETITDIEIEGFISEIEATQRRI